MQAMLTSGFKFDVNMLQIGLILKMNLPSSELHGC
jgi:hypothetical protein